MTGASSGIGEQLAVECARRGARDVILVARTRANLNKVAESIRKRFPEVGVHVFDCDVSVLFFFFFFFFSLRLRLRR